MCWTRVVLLPLTSVQPRRIANKLRYFCCTEAMFKLCSWALSSRHAINLMKKAKRPSPIIANAKFIGVKIAIGAAVSARIGIAIINIAAIAKNARIRTQAWQGTADLKRGERRNTMGKGTPLRDLIMSCCNYCGHVPLFYRAFGPFAPLF